MNDWNSAPAGNSSFFSGMVDQENDMNLDELPRS